jgi:hypothetical protein
MLPSGHIATGVLLGVRRSRRSGGPAGVAIAGGVAASCLPDLDLLAAPLLDRLGVRHGLCSGRHHSWVTHTPVFWAGVIAGAQRLGRRHGRPRSWDGAVELLAVGVSLHLLQDSVANTVALLWPLRRREYGLGLDRLPGVTDHVEYMRRYPASPAGRLEAALVLSAASVAVRHLAQRRARSSPC